MKDVKDILVTSLVASKTQLPRVDITFVEKNFRIQLSADEAFDFAKNILEVATGAYADAFIVHFLLEKVFKNDPATLTNELPQVLCAFREFRDKLAQDFKSYQQ